MMASEMLLQLELEDQAKVESLLVAFDETWHGQALSDWVASKLPERGDRLRPIVLIELVKIDLERQWQAGHPVTLASYLEQYAELGPLKAISADLVFAEIQVRRQFGENVDVDEFLRRFPSQRNELEALLERAEHQGTETEIVEPRCTTPESETSRAHPDGDTLNKESSSDGNSFENLPVEFGRYRIEKQLGQGGMGAVYLAHDTQLDRKVALKIPHFSASDGHEVVDRFLREARAAGTLHHPNLCPIYDVGESNGVHYMTMAYIEGRPLSAYIDSGKLISERQAAIVVRSLALAMHEAHTRGIIHRDLKPGNVMIDGRNQPVIMDFGLARRSETNDAVLTQAGALLGSPAYMSPEQAQGKIEEIGPGSDIYSLGVIFYEMLTGKRPFRGELIELLTKIVTAEPEPPSQYRPGLAPKLEAICLKAMAKSPAQRFASAADMAQALTEYLREAGKSSRQGESAAPVIGPPPGPPACDDIPQVVSKPRLRPGNQPVASKRLSAQRRNWIVAAGLAALVVISFGIVLLLQTPEGTVRIALSDPQAQVDVSVDGRSIEIKGTGEPLRFEVGEHQLIVQGKDYELHTQSFTVHRGDNPPIQVELLPRVMPAPQLTENSGFISDRLEHQGKVRFVSFSPDGRMLASGDELGYMKLWDVDTGRELRKLRMEGTEVSSAIEFHPQGRFLAAGDSSRAGSYFKLWSMPELKEVAPFADMPHWLPPFTFSPDGKFLFSIGPEHTIVIWDLETRAEHARISGLEKSPKHLSVSADGKRLVSTDRDRTFRVWNVETREQLHEFTYTPPKGAPFKDAYFAMFTPDTKQIIVGVSTDLATFDLETGAKAWGFRRHLWTTIRGALTPDGKGIITVGGEGDIDHAAVTNLDTGKSIRILRNHKGAWDVAFHPSGKILATAGPDKTIKLWDLSDWSKVRERFQSNQVE